MTVVLRFVRLLWYGAPLEEVGVALGSLVFCHLGLGYALKVIERILCAARRRAYLFFGRGHGAGGRAEREHRIRRSITNFHRLRVLIDLERCLRLEAGRLWTVHLSSSTTNVYAKSLRKFCLFYYFLAQPLHFLR